MPVETNRPLYFEGFSPSNVRLQKFLPKKCHWFPRPASHKGKGSILEVHFLLGGEQVPGAPKTKMTMDFHDQFQDGFDIKNDDFLVSILVFREAIIRKICQFSHFSNDYQVKLIIIDYSQEASRDRYCCQFLTSRKSPKP